MPDVPLRTQARTTFRTRHELDDILRRSPKAQAWRVGSEVSTVKVGKQTYRRMFEPIETLIQLGEDLTRADRTPFASSWGGIWRKYGTFPPRMPPVAKGIVEAEKGTAVIRHPHPWIEQRAEVGTHPGAWQEWDLSSAYAWASAQGLPDLRTVHRSARRSISDTGIYLCEGPIQSEGQDPVPWLLPTWMRWKDTRECAPGLFDWRIRAKRMRDRRLAWIPGEILNRMGLAPVKVRVALEWDRETDIRPTLDQVRNDLPRWWKCVYRAHWGDWGAHSPCSRESWEGGRLVSQNYLPMGLRAPLWAWMVQSRVTARVSSVAEHAARVFIDSATTPAEFSPPACEVGTEPGQWKRKVRYPSGLVINGLPWRPSLSQPATFSPSVSIRS